MATATGASRCTHSVGDDHDEIDVTYSGAGAPIPANQVIFTGNGGNPFGEAGWTGWFALANGTALASVDEQFDAFPGIPSLMMGPCFQTGVLSATLNSGCRSWRAVELEGPTEFCGTESDVSDMPIVSAPGANDVVTASSNDNRAFIDPNNSPDTTGVT